MLILYSVPLSGLITIQLLLIGGFETSLSALHFILKLILNLFIVFINVFDIKVMSNVNEKRLMKTAIIISIIFWSGPI